MTTVLIHPIGLDRTTWDTAEVEGAIAIDLPGHGEAPWVDLESLGDVADHVIRELPAGRLDLVGLSLGGMVVLHAALRHPGRVRSVVVACAPAAAPTATMLQRAQETELLGMRGTLEATMTRWFSPGVLRAAPPFIAAAEQRLLADDPDVVAHYWRLIAGHDVAARLGELAMPATVIAGSGDVSVPPSAARALADAVPGSRYVELDGAHMLHLEAPIAFAAAVAAHLEALPDRV